MNQRLSERACSLFTGAWAGLVVAWHEDGTLDEAMYRADVARCCDAGVAGVYTGGTSGEFYAQSFEEFERIAEATVEVCRAHGTPVMIGCTATGTREAVRRARVAARLEADAIQVALPFWMPVPDDRVVPFFEAVAAAAPQQWLSLYETPRAAKSLTLEQHERLAQAVPRYAMVKAGSGTIGATPRGCAALARLVRVFTNEVLWPRLGPHGTTGVCSAMVYWNPGIVHELFTRLQRQDWTGLATAMTPVDALHQHLFDTFGPRGFTDTAYDRMMSRTTGFLETSLTCRGPYPSPTADDVAAMQGWCAQHWPALLDLPD